jgi:hypothetical protein
MTEQRIEEAVVQELAGKIAEYLEGEGGAVAESALVREFRGFGRIRTAALRWLAERGHVRRVRAKGTGARLTTLEPAGRDDLDRTRLIGEHARLVFEPASVVVAFTTMPGHVIEATPGLQALRQDSLVAERREALKPTAEEYGTDTDSYRFYMEQLAARTMSPGEVPFRVTADREDCPKAKRPRRWKGEAVSEKRYTAAAQTARRERETRDALSPEIRRRIERQVGTGEAAWRTAKAHYVASLPTLSHKILHLLKRDGARTEASFVALAEAEEYPLPEKAVREALTELAEAGKIRRVRSRKTGRQFLVPLERMGERELETLLIGVLADEKSGIPVPANTKLARRVEGFRKARAARCSAPDAEVEEASEQPVEA